MDTLDQEWKPITHNLTDKLKTAQDNLQQEINKIPGLAVFPPAPRVFKALSLVKPSDIQVVIIGQDCYHQPEQALGVAFGVPPSIRNPPSLVNIIREIRNDTGQLLQDSTLTSWANQGVLLLNSALTVHQAKPGSHLKLWRDYTDHLIQNISHHTKGVVWLLWGGFAKGKKPLIKGTTHLILEANHPSPLSANRGGWFGCKHFSKTNHFLEKNGKRAIVWGKPLTDSTTT